jgi:Ca2+-binding EF-hand superfamily protein
MQARQYLSALAAVAMLGVGTAAAAAQSQDDQYGRAQNNGRRMRYQGMDTNGDGVITRSEWRGNMQSFRQHDLNNDGVLSGNEVWVPAGQRDPIFGDRNVDQRSIADAFRRADVNNDGVIARDEWYGDYNTFNRVDRNNDNRISRSEFMGEEDETVGTSGYSTFNELDRNGNGVITANEWIGTRADFDTLDTDNDGVITRNEYQARQDINRSNAYRTGYTRGLAEGRQAGREDRTINGGRWDLEGQRELEQADSGYTSSVGSRAEYQNGYRAGFRRGYEQGFGNR